jgi:hypothetical protein
MGHHHPPQGFGNAPGQGKADPERVKVLDLRMVEEYVFLPESVYHGKRMKNGWKNSAPWTYNSAKEKNP